MKNDKEKRKTTKSIAKNKKVKRTQNKARVVIKHLQNPPWLGQGGNKKKKNHHIGRIYLLLNWACQKWSKWAQQENENELNDGEVRKGKWNLHEDHIGTMVDRKKFKMDVNTIIVE